MREIKFRAINSAGEMIFGLPYTDGINRTIYFKEFNNRLCWRNEKGQSCNQPYKNGTLMQYTGLKDKNGVDIYEGDLLRFLIGRNEDAVKFEKSQLVEVKQMNACWGFEHVFKDEVHEDDREFTPFWIEGDKEMWNQEYFEVIGNIYENHELLEDCK